MAMVVVDDSCLQANSQPKSGGLVWGSTAALRFSTFIKWTEWTLAMTCGHDDSTINIVLGIILIIINIQLLQQHAANTVIQQKHVHKPADAAMIWTLFRLILNLLNARWCKSSSDSFYAAQHKMFINKNVIQFYNAATMSIVICVVTLTVQ